MSSKVPEIVFACKALNGELVYANPQDMHDYCIEHDGEDLFNHIEEAVKLSAKMKMYRFYYVNVLECALIGYTTAGYEGMDKVKCDYLLRAEFAKDFIQKPDGSFVPIMIDKRNMTKARLLKFIQDSIFFIEETLQVRVASSEEYKLKKETGNKNYRLVK